MRALVAMLATVICACGRYGFDERADAGSGLDSEPIGCLDEPPLGSWGPVTQVMATESPTADDDDPEPSADGLELYFVSTRAGGLGLADIWRVRRTAPSEPWGVPENVPALSSDARENTVALSNDGLTAWVVSDRVGTIGDDDIWQAHRDHRDAPWSMPVNVTELNSPLDDRGPSVFLADTAMWFHSFRTGANQMYRTSRSGDGLWTMPEMIGGQAGIRPWVSPCGLELYFQASPGPMMFDFYLKRRASLSEEFGTAALVSELNTASNEQDLRLSPDRQHAYFASSRDGPSKIYEARR